jgi:uncharacterized protein YbjT (DUF2867 family)
MKRILVTGGTGGLGSVLVPALMKDYQVRVLTRSPHKLPEGVEAAQGDIETGLNADAVKDVDIIIHAASSPFDSNVDTGGAKRLLALAPNIEHFVYISIIGVDRIPFSYYQQKYATEQVIQHSRVPWTIIRAPQFFPFVEMVMEAFCKLPIGLVLKGSKHQPMATEEVAEFIAQCIQEGAACEVRTITGREVFTMKELAQSWLAAQGKRKPVLEVPLPGKMANAFRKGYNTDITAPQGQQTWDNYLQQKYG